MADNYKFIIEQNGIVVSRFIKAPTNEFINDRGVKVAAQGQRYIVRVVTGSSFTTADGYTDANITEYRVSLEEYNKFQWNTPVIVQLEVTN